MISVRAIIPKGWIWYATETHLMPVIVGKAFPGSNSFQVRGSFCSDKPAKRCEITANNLATEASLPTSLGSDSKHTIGRQQAMNFLQMQLRQCTSCMQQCARRRHNHRDLPMI